MANLIGQKFNRLLVMEKTPERKAGSIVWKCLCDCGNITYVSSRDLKSNNTKSCGCLNREKRIERIQKYNSEEKEKIIVGKRYGKLIALEKTDMRKESHVIWKCQCDCGNITYVRATYLEQGVTQSCGCLKSKGEELIGKLLKEANIPFEKECSFNDCRFPDTKCKAYFDFYVNKKYIIEFDGIQHFQNGTGCFDNEEAFFKRKIRDNYKNQYCKNKNIPLIRIPYTQLKKLTIKDLLLETSAFIITEQQLKDMIN